MFSPDLLNLTTVKKMVKNPNSFIFNFCPQCGSERIEADSLKSFTCSACGFQLFLNCASAAIGLILTPENQLIITRRKNNPFKGMLDFPGGFADPGETIETTLKREIKEELNLDTHGWTYQCSLPGIYEFKDIQYSITDLVFSTRIDSIQGIQARDDILNFYFMDTGQLETSQFGLHSARTLVQLLRQNQFGNF